VRSPSQRGSTHAPELAQTRVPQAARREDTSTVVRRAFFGICLCAGIARADAPSVPILGATEGRLRVDTSMGYLVGEVRSAPLFVHYTEYETNLCTRGIKTVVLSEVVEQAATRRRARQLGTTCELLRASLTNLVRSA
jgi:hypothetical protein